MTHIAHIAKTSLKIKKEIITIKENKENNIYTNY